MRLFWVHGDDLRFSRFVAASHAGGIAAACADQWGGYALEQEAA